MKGCTSWSYAPYCPPRFDSGEVYVCRLAPACTGVTADWLVTPDDRLVTVMRYQMERCTPNYGRVLVFSVDEAHPEAPLRYSHAMEFPGNHAKFVIRRDPVSGWCYSIVCRIRGSACAGDRNLCSLLKSPDMTRWQVAADLLDGTGEDPRLVGYQYVDWIIDGEDILFLCRTARNGATSYHDSNYSTFRRVSRFRAL